MGADGAGNKQLVSVFLVSASSLIITLLVAAIMVQPLALL